MKLLDKAIEAQKNGTFPDWYQSLSDERREQFNTELHEIIERVSQSFAEFINYMQDTMPMIFAIFAQMLIDFSKQMRSNK